MFRYQEFFLEKKNTFTRSQIKLGDEKPDVNLVRYGGTNMIRIVIAEEQPMLLHALGTLLNLEEDMEVVGQANNSADAITLVHELKPDICIMDIDMPDKSGLEVAEALMVDGYTKIVLLATFARKGYFQRAVKAGISGYLLMDSPSEFLAGSIRSVIAGKQVYERELLEEVKDEDPTFLDVDSCTDVYLEQPTTPIGAVKAYISIIKDKMKMPTG
jgi:two-component system, NarL family, response regulator DesR